MPTEVIMEASSLSKMFFLISILLASKLLWLMFSVRKRDNFLFTVFVVQLVLLSIYIVFTTFEVIHPSWLPMWLDEFGRAAMGVLLLSADLMLLEYIIRHTRRKKQ